MSMYRPGTPTPQPSRPAARPLTGAHRAVLAGRLHVPLLLARKQCTSVPGHDDWETAELIDALAQAAGNTAIARLLETGLTDGVTIGSSYHAGALSKTVRTWKSEDNGATIRRT
ncbi:hypothetical protein [Streptomyces sp900116325]|uniref:hypothetical protein n=1 Tax=Streptomyces sp. 900116325 TaxID=3154295 RepID=UPI0033C1430D